MSPENFVFWFRGFSESVRTQRPTEEQWDTIKDHLQTVSTRATPDTIRDFRGTVLGRPWPWPVDADNDSNAR